MLSPRWMKLARDVQLTPGRIVMMLLATAAGVFGLATMLSSYTILTREIKQNYLDTNPASAILRLDKLDAPLIEAIRSFPGIAAAQASAVVGADIQAADGSIHPMTLFIIGDFKKLRINTIYPEAGAWPPQPGTILLERDSLKQLKLKIGDTIQIKLADGRLRQVIVSGTAHDPAMPVPSASAFAYVSPEGAQAIGFNTSLRDLKVTVTEKPFDIDGIERTAAALAFWLQQQGHVVERIRIPPPGEHPHQLIMNSILGMLLVFSGIALLLSAVLTATIIEGLLAQQVRQIGVMKTIGARSSQIATLYLAFVLIMSLLASCIGAPAGLAAGRAFSQLVLVSLLNFTMHSAAVPDAVYLLLCFAGVVIPLCIAGIPIIKATHVSAQAAMTDYGTTQKYFHGAESGSWCYRVPGIDRGMRMALRNSFRRKGRLLLALVLLGMAGATFISSLNVRKASQQHLLEAAAERHYDLEINLSKLENGQKMISVISAVPGVNLVEAWSSAVVARHRPDGLNIERTYPDGGHGALNVSAIPFGSRLISMQMQSGSWLHNDKADGNEGVVLNEKALDSFPKVKIGDTISLGMRGNVATLRLVGIVRQKMVGAMAYVAPATLKKMTGQGELYKSFRVVMARHDAKTIDEVTGQIANALAKQQIAIGSSITETVLRKEVDAHFDLLVNALLFIAILMALVGILGLGSTMSTNVSERTREFGIMRSIGASSGMVMRNVLAEGLFVGLMSWFVAIFLALPLSMAISTFLGKLLFDEAFPLVISRASIAIWLLLVLSGSSLACAYPAWKASRLSIRASFSY